MGESKNEQKSLYIDGRVFSPEPFNKNTLRQHGYEFVQNISKSLQGQIIRANIVNNKHDKQILPRHQHHSL